MNASTEIIPAQPPGQKPDHALIAFLLELKANDDRGTLAMLRGALSSLPERQRRAWRVLARFGVIPADDSHEAETVRTVAGLFAHAKMQHQRNERSFGKACTELLGDDEQKSLWKADQPGPVSRRVQHLLAASREEVCDRVCLLGRRLAVEGASLDFSRLLNDLRFWNDKVKARWAADFWGADARDETAKEATP